MTVTALGTAGSWTGEGRACAGYLVEVRNATGQARLLFDAGFGSSVNLQRWVRLDHLDAMFVTHRHPDHWFDLVSMLTALRLDPSLQLREPIPLYAPADMHDELLRVLSPSAAEYLPHLMALQPIEGSQQITVVPQTLAPGLEISSFPMAHSVPAVGWRIAWERIRVAYTGDSAWCDGLVACAQGADLLLSEATWQGEAHEHPAGGHLTARQAGELAREAGVGQLVLTHIQAGLDVDISVAQAAEHFDGPVTAASDGDQWTLPAAGVCA